MKCQREGCERDAEGIVKITVPAQGVPIDLHTPLTAMLGLEVCAEHAVGAVDLVRSDKLQEVMRIQARIAAGEGREPLPPDFGRGFTSLVRYGSAEYRTWAKLTAKGSA